MAAIDQPTSRLGADPPGQSSNHARSFRFAGAVLRVQQSSNHPSSEGPESIEAVRSRSCRTDGEARLLRHRVAVHVPRPSCVAFPPGAQAITRPPAPPEACGEEVDPRHGKRPAIVWAPAAAELGGFNRRKERGRVTPANCREVQCVAPGIVIGAIGPCPDRWSALGTLPAGSKNMWSKRRTIAISMIAVGLMIASPGRGGTSVRIPWNLRHAVVGAGRAATGQIPDRRARRGPPLLRPGDVRVPDG